MDGNKYRLLQEAATASTSVHYMRREGPILNWPNLRVNYLHSQECLILSHARRLLSIYIVNRARASRPALCYPSKCSMLSSEWLFHHGTQDLADRSRHGVPTSKFPVYTTTFSGLNPR